ncbi:hypothetical protein ACGLHS_13430 [Variovorax sp. VaC1]|uniref:hypothetical protein n=1 Tax=Variovorax sp. VaC1 TaxID=3373132 RepID=UPI003748CF91
MDPCQAPYRDLLDALYNSSPAEDVFQTLLRPWLDAHAEERDWLNAFAHSTSHAPIAIEDSWRLYALSRVNQVLLLAFQRDEGEGWAGPALSLPDYLAFMTGLGCRVADEADYSPFFHEIVEVSEERNRSSRRKAVELARVDWPALMLGTMLFSRAGVAVSCAFGALHSEIATSSTLFWACRRKHRRTSDLSDGWGSNSQWRTTFRRDYVVGDELLFNADGKHDLAAPGLPASDDDLTVAERIELLTHRCFIRCEKPDDDLYPYGDRVRLPRIPG